MEQLVAAQRELRGRIARTIDNLRKAGAAKITIALVRSTLLLLDQKWAKFEDRHDALLSGLGEQAKSHEYFTTNVVSQVEEAYLQQRTALLELEQTLQATKAVGEAGQHESLSCSDAPHVVSSLPKIQLPEFSGEFEDWPAFRDLFTSLICKDSRLSSVEKLHFLKVSIKGDAEQLIQSLTITGENFQHAWSLLARHYDNKRLLLRARFSTFLSLQRMRSESAVDLRRIFNGMLNTVGSLEGMGRPIDSNTDLFVHLVVELLDSRTRRKWEDSLGGSREPPSYSDLRAFLEQRLHTLAAVAPDRSTSRAPRGAGSTHVVRTHHARSRDSCSFCAGKHFVLFCDRFKARPAEERRAAVMRSNLCLNCLGRHSLNVCGSSKRCSHCSEKHHSLLHDAFVSGNPLHKTVASGPTAHLAHHSRAKCPSVLLATARVRVADAFGGFHGARALIDPGSETSLISESLAQRLRLRRSGASVAIIGVGGQRTGVTRGRVLVTVTSRFGDAEVKVPSFILPRLSSYGHEFAGGGCSWPFLDGLKLADPDFFGSESIELLLGADAFSLLVLDGLRKGGPGEPIAMNTTFGWIISGAVGEPQLGARIAPRLCAVDEDLSVIVRRFWEQEEAPTGAPPLSPEDRKCMEHFAATHTRLADGRYVVRLPLARDLPDLSDTRRPALHMLCSVERRFRRDSAFRERYRDFMLEYEGLGHMTRLAADNAPSPGRHCYLPHHGVLKGAAASAKLRVVFNGSLRTRAGHSLNSSLLVGPNLIPRLADVLLAWRRYRYVFVADVEKMYRQIQVHAADRDLQRILWGGEDAVREFQLNTVTYGTASAPFLAVRTLQQLAQDEGKHFPLGAKILEREVYVDDILTGAPTVAEALTARRQLEHICDRGGFPLRKWASNVEAILAGIPEAHRAVQSTLAWYPDDCHSTLGLEWRPHEDTFSFTIRAMDDGVSTKRGILSQASQLFDPLGWMSPVTVRAKCIIQSTWLRRIGWDDRLPREDIAAWDTFRKELPLLRKLRIPRWLGVGDGRDTVELHGFADASECAYAAVLYTRTVSSGRVNMALLLAKTRVAPLRQLSLPRLELCAASLLASLTAHAAGILGLAASAIHLWSDSMVTLGWIQGHPCRWTTFVANRVADIQRALPDVQWHHVQGHCNPADCASRGIAPSTLVDHALWWQGPDFLRTPGWTSPPSCSGWCELPEQRRAVRLVQLERRESDLLTRHSTLVKLLRTTAWMRRWLSTLRHRRAGAAVLSPGELLESESLWVRHAQAVAFAAELEDLAGEGPLPRRSTLRPLAPFKDSEGMLRVGGRLKHAVLSHDERHPIILPPRSHFTRLTIEAFHRRTLHGGVQLTLGLLRRRFWIPTGRQLVRRAIQRCPTCVRWRAASPQPLMSSLPGARVAPGRPFLRTGVDCAGPILVRSARGRGHSSSKAFLVIFVCFTSRAVHLEVASDYSTNAFLAAFRRFTARRGLCREVFSDCGTNFVGADAQLRELFRSSSTTARGIANCLASEGTLWHFNPPGAPHFGGLWEAAVKSVKHHLRRVLGSHTLTFEELTTLLAQVEACLNSRPLQALSDDPEDLTALTPGHFLIGEPLLSIPEPSLAETPQGRLDRWQLVQQMRDHLWRRWSREYVTSLIARSKWHAKAPPLELGQLCLVRSETTPASRWPLARICELHPGDGGEVRVVTVRTATSRLTRPVVKIVPLPIACSADDCA